MLQPFGPVQETSRSQTHPCPLPSALCSRPSQLPKHSGAHSYHHSRPGPRAIGQRRSSWLPVLPRARLVHSISTHKGWGQAWRAAGWLGRILTAVLARAAGAILIDQDPVGALRTVRGGGAGAGVAGCLGREGGAQGPLSDPVLLPPGPSATPVSPGVLTTRGAQPPPRARALVSLGGGALCPQHPHSPNTPHSFSVLPARCKHLRTLRG